jgi:hypothetical protein
VTSAEERDLHRLQLIGDLLENTSNRPIGDLLIGATQIFEEIEETLTRYVAEEAMRGIRSLASRADPSTPLFSKPMKMDQSISDLEYLQLMRIQWAIHELCYACEMVQTASIVTWGGSTPTRLYLNAIYHYTSSLFLVDTSKPTHKDLPLGGTVIRALHPLSLDDLLDPIKEILEEPFGEITYGDAILKLRHSDLVHGDFSPERVEYLVEMTEMRNPMQQEHFAELTWRMFHRLLILNLKLMAYLESTGMDAGAVTLRYALAQVERKRK